MTPWLLLPPAYLLVGCLLMLRVNELAQRSLTKGEILWGTLTWPRGIVGFFEFLVSAIWERYRG